MKVSTAIALTLLLTACAGNPPPKIDYDNEDFVPAVQSPEPPRPVEIVEVPKPLPLPGQLKPLTRPVDQEPDFSDPLDTVDEANEAARREPGVDGYINAMQVYPFTEGALYRVYAAPEQVTDVALQRGEELVAVSAGDTVRWVIGDTISGSGAESRVHVLVKPFEAGLVTNMVVTTNRRTYHLEMESLDQTYMASVSWHYPRDELLALKGRSRKAVSEEAEEIDRGLDLARLRFRYEVTGDDPPWRPLRAFDDGRKVYIEFPRGLFQGEAPPLFVVGPDGDAQLVNYRVKDNYYIVDRLFAAAELRLGEAPQQIVRISRTDTVGGTAR